MPTTTMTANSAATTNPVPSYLALHESFEKQRDATASPLVRRLRSTAAARFVALGFPGPRDEEWRATNPAPLLRAEFRIALPAPIDEVKRLLDRVPTIPNAIRLVIANGQFLSDLSDIGVLPPGLTLNRLATGGHDGHWDAHLARYAKAETNVFVALNTMFLEEGVLFHLAPRTIVERPIHVIHLTLGQERASVTFPRMLLIAGSESEASLVETFVSREGEANFCCPVSEILLGAQAHVRHVKLNFESTAGFHVAAMQVQVAGTANFASRSVTFGGGLVRNDFQATFEGPGAECTLDGLYLADGHRLIDNHTTIDHAYPHCNSHELYKGILAGAAKGVFNGKIFVRQDAQKTDAKQTNQTLLLSPEATIHTKPQLEIFADDVKCTHGATVGHLDDESLFYLRSRGLAKAEAERLLVLAFANDVLDRITIPGLRDALEERLLTQSLLQAVLPT